MILQTSSWTYHSGKSGAQPMGSQSCLIMLSALGTSHGSHKCPREDLHTSLKQDFGCLDSGSTLRRESQQQQQRRQQQQQVCCLTRLRLLRARTHHTFVRAALFNLAPVIWVCRAWNRARGGRMRNRGLLPLTRMYDVREGNPAARPFAEEGQEYLCAHGQCGSCGIRFFEGTRIKFSSRFAVKAILPIVYPCTGSSFAFESSSPLIYVGVKTYYTGVDGFGLLSRVHWTWKCDE